MTEKLERINNLLRSNQPESIKLGIITALTACNFEECQQIFPYFYAQDEPVSAINIPYSDDHIYIKDKIAIIVVSCRVFCRELHNAHVLSYFDRFPKTYL